VLKQSLSHGFGGYITVRGMEKEAVSIMDRGYSIIQPVITGQKSMVAFASVTLATYCDHFSPNAATQSQTPNRSRK